MRKGTAQSVTIAAATLVVAGCIDMTSPSSSLAVAGVRRTAAGFTLTDNSFAGDGTTGGAFMPRMDHGGRRGGPMNDISGHGAIGGGLGINRSQHEQQVSLGPVVRQHSPFRLSAESLRIRSQGKWYDK